MRSKTKARLLRLERWAAKLAESQNLEPDMFLLKRHVVTASLGDSFDRAEGEGDSEVFARVLGYSNHEDMARRMVADWEDCQMRLEAAWHAVLEVRGFKLHDLTPEEEIQNLVYIFEALGDKICKNAHEELSKAVNFYGINVAPK